MMGVRTIVCQRIKNSPAITIPSAMSLGYLSDIMSMFNSGPLTGYPPNLQTYYTSFMTITVAELYILLTDLSAVTGGDTGAAPPDGG